MLELASCAVAEAVSVTFCMAAAEAAEVSLAAEVAGFIARDSTHAALLGMSARPALASCQS